MELQKAENKKTSLDRMQEGYEANNELIKEKQSTASSHNKSTYDVIKEKIEAGETDGIDPVSLISYGFDQISTDNDKEGRREARKEMHERAVNGDAWNQTFAEQNPDVVNGE